MKKLLMQLCVLFAAFFFYSCGNTLLDFIEGTIPDGGTTGIAPSAPGSTVTIPQDVTPIYIDTQQQFQDLCYQQTSDYPADGYYILRGNGVPGRVFHTVSPYYPTFKGTLTGWYTNEAQKTTIKINGTFTTFFEKAVVAGTKSAVEISHLKFEREGSLPPVTSSPYLIGIVAPEATNTHFINVTVSGTVDVSLADPSGDVYAGGIVGKAGTDTTFESCNVASPVSVTLTTNTSGKNVYVGGIAGEMLGSVTKSRVVGTSYPISVKVSSEIQSGGAGEVYVGGIAGKLTGVIEETTVYAEVSASAGTGNAYGGGVAGSVEGGKIKFITSNDYNSLSVSATSAGVAYAGGLAGKSTGSLTNNRLSSVSIKSMYSGGSSYAGGLVGYLEGALGSPATIEGSSVTGTIQSCSQVSSGTPGTAYAGGLAGSINEYSSVKTSSFSSSSSYSLGVSAGFDPYSYPLSATVYASTAYAGGIVGYAKGTISQVAVSAVVEESDTASTASGGIDARVSATDGIAAAGGIAGKNEGTISESYAVVTVKARTKATATNAGEGASAGGISGISTHKISDTFALAKVDARPLENISSKAQAGGIVGYLDGASASVETSYAAGWVLAYAASNAQAGGIAGYVGTSLTPAINKSVALQQYVASGGGLHRVVGNLGSSSVAGSYAYKFMKSGVSGDDFNVTENAATEEGGDISKNDATSPSYYTTSLGWNNIVWTSSYIPYPMLKCFSDQNLFPNPPPYLYAPGWALLP